MKDRIRAFFIHLAISSVIAIFAMIAVFYIWYPSPLHKAVGVTEIFLIILAVDIIVGPVITFVIFNRKKPSLRFDLAVIAILQLFALSYGMSTVFNGRPAFVVFNIDRFDVARASDLDPESVTKAKQDGNETGIAGWLKPHWVAAVQSSNLERRNEILFSSVKGGSDLPQLPELYVPLPKVEQQILQRAKSLQALYDLYNDHDEKLKDLDKWKENNKVKWLPMRGTVKDMIVLVDADSANIIKIIDISPWL